jgi:hypothetical protein
MSATSSTFAPAARTLAARRDRIHARITEAMVAPDERYTLADIFADVDRRCHLGALRAEYARLDREIDQLHRVDSFNRGLRLGIDEVRL